MKFALPAILSIIICSCVAQRDIQVDTVLVELVEIDTVQRHMNTAEQMLTWKTQDDIRYVSYASLNSHYLIGTRMQVMMRK